MRGSPIWSIRCYVVLNTCIQLELYTGWVLICWERGEGNSWYYYYYERIVCLYQADWSKLLPTAQQMWRRLLVQLVCWHNMYIADLVLFKLWNVSANSHCVLLVSSRYLDKTCWEWSQEERASVDMLNWFFFTNIFISHYLLVFLLFLLIGYRNLFFWRGNHVILNLTGFWLA